MYDRQDIAFRNKIVTENPRFHLLCFFFFFFSFTFSSSYFGYLIWYSHRRKWIKDDKGRTWVRIFWQNTYYRYWSSMKEEISEVDSCRNLWSQSIYSLMQPSSKRKANWFYVWAVESPRLFQLLTEVLELEELNSGKWGCFFPLLLCVVAPVTCLISSSSVTRIITTA